MDYHRNVEIYLDVKQNEHEAILAGSERASNSVSYTHLTLPTIYSV